MNVMKNAVIQAITINPFLKTIIKSKIENSLKSMQHAIGDYNVQNG